jgi:GNAT superfamily N-acetyltransferase
VNDDQLYARGISTSVASWRAYSAGSPDAQVHVTDSWSAAVFPSGPEREVYNNAVLVEGLDVRRLSQALAQLEDAYAEAQVERYAVWVTEHDSTARQTLVDRGYAIDTTTAAMGRVLGPPTPRQTFEAGPTTWTAYLDDFLPDGHLRGIDGSGFEVVTALLDGELVAAALGFEHEGDLGVFNVETHARARRRGLATALTSYLVGGAVKRGCATATLQATPMAERVYEACGFRAVARILEYVPGDADGAPARRPPRSPARARPAPASRSCSAG